MYRKLSIFDFDTTLIKTPTPNDGLEIIKSELNKQLDINSFWEDVDSLNVKIFDIKINKKTYNDYIIEKNNKDNLLVLLTSRNEKLKPNILKILNDFNIKFDINLFYKKGKYKTDRINELLNYYHNIEEIEIWDDRDIEIQRYNIWKNSVQTENQKIKIKINKVE